jgi:hypothetical protein
LREVGVGYNDAPWLLDVELEIEAAQEEREPDEEDRD